MNLKILTVLSNLFYGKRKIMINEKRFKVGDLVTWVEDPIGGEIEDEHFVRKTFAKWHGYGPFLVTEEVSPITLLPDNKYGSRLKNVETNSEIEGAPFSNDWLRLVSA